MLVLFDAETDQPVGQITEEQFRFLMAQLEEESTLDREYYISQAELAILEQAGCAPALLSTLRSALAGREGMDIQIVREHEEDYG